jgi:branched-chain amino acid transport system ATP-binding protein
VSEALLEVEGVHAGYGDVAVLWGVDLEVREGEIVCLVGSNGAGKTTLLRTLSALVARRKGSIRLGGAELPSGDPVEVLRAGVAHVPEGRRLFGAMSVHDNLLMGAYLRRDGAAAVKADLERIYELFPILRQRRHQDAATLSGGEQQMCAIGRGLMSAPRVLLIDELSLGLAPAVVDSLCDALRALNKAGLTLLVVEQDVATALELAQHAVVMDSGRIARAGRSDELAHDPAIQKAYLGTL